MDRRPARLERRGALPAGDRLGIAAPVVEQIAETGRGPRILWVGRDRRLEDGDLLGPGREAPAGIGSPGSGPLDGRPAGVSRAAPLVQQPGQRVVDERSAAELARVPVWGARLAGGQAVGEEFDGLVEEACRGVVVGDVEQDLGVEADPSRSIAGRQLQLPGGPGVERIELERGGGGGSGLGAAARPPQDRRLQVARPQVARPGGEGPLELLEGRCLVAPEDGQLGEGMAGGAGPRHIPGGLGERVPSRLAEGVRLLRRRASRRGAGPQGEAEEVVRLPVRRVGVARRGAGDRSPGVLLRREQLAATDVPAGHRRVRAGVAGIPTERLAPVVLGESRRVTVLLQVETGEVELLLEADLRRQRRLRGRRRHRPRRALDRPVPDQLPPVGGRDPQLEVGGPEAGRNGELGQERGIGREVDGPIQEGRPVRAVQPDGRPRAAGRDVDADPCRRADQAQAHRRVEVGEVGRADPAERVPGLAERPRLTRGEEAEVGLVVRVDAGHQLDVRPPVVGELAVPGAAEGVVAPRPLLLAGADPAVGDVDDAGPRPVVVAAEEVERAVEGHVGGRHRDVAVPGKVRLGLRAGPVVDAVVRPACDRELAHRSLGVVGHEGDVRREERLVVIVDLHGSVRPPQEGLGHRRPVVEAHPELQHGAPRPQADAVHPLHSPHRLVLGQPGRPRSVGRGLDRPVGRQVGRRAVVLGPVELDPAGDPRSQQADEGRLDHVLAIEEVVAVGEIAGQEDAPAELRQDHHPEILVLQVQRRPGARRADVGDAIREGIRVDAPGAALVDPLLQEHRVRVRERHLVGREDERRRPGRDRDAGGDVGSWAGRQLHGARGPPGRDRQGRERRGDHRILAGAGSPTHRYTPGTSVERHGRDVPRMPAGRRGGGAMSDEIVAGIRVRPGGTASRPQPQARRGGAGAPGDAG